MQEKNISKHGLSIIVPHLNASKHLSRLLISLKEQSFQNWKLIIVDGNSFKEEKSYLDKISREEKRIEVISQEKNFIGIYGAMNQGLYYKRKNDWITFWGADDWLPDKNTLSKLINEIRLLPSSVDLNICRVMYVGSNNVSLRKSQFTSNQGIIDSREYIHKIFCGYVPPHQGAVFSPKCFINKKYNEYFKIAADLDFFIYMYKSKNIIINSSNILLLNLSPGGASQKYFLLKIKELIIIYFKIFGILFLFPFFVRYIKRLKSIKRLF